MTDTFRSAYGVLQRHAQTLRTQREPDIDDLLDIVTQSVAAYKVCQARITAVEQALEQALSGSGANAPEAAESESESESGSNGEPDYAPRSGDPGNPRPDGADFEDDIPF